MHMLAVIAAGILIFVLIAHSLAKKRRPLTHTAAASPYEAIVGAADFNELVLETSRSTPVMVDFFATWCGPCQYLGPQLSAMAARYQGRFLLAKVDVDENQELSTQYRIEAMPTVMLFRNGECVGKFVGMLQEHAIRYFLAKHGILAPELTQLEAQQSPTSIREE